MMGRTILVPTDGSWKEAPQEMPEPDQHVLVLLEGFPQVAFVNRRYAGWALITVARRDVNFRVFADFEEEVFWAPLLMLSELRVSREAEDSQTSV